MCPILFALLFFLLLFALFFSASVVLFVGQRQKQITKLFFVFFLLLIAISEANSMCVFVCPRKTLKKNGSRKIFISIFLASIFIYQKSISYWNQTFSSLSENLIFISGTFVSLLIGFLLQTLVTFSLIPIVLKTRSLS